MHFDLLDERSSHWLRVTGFTIAGVWAAWWTLFGVASGFEERLSPLGVTAHAAMPGFVFLISVLIAWRSEIFGATLLLGEGLVVLFVYPALAMRMPVATIVFVLLTMAVPPMLAGALLLLASRPGVRPIRH